MIMMCNAMILATTSIIFQTKRSNEFPKLPPKYQPMIPTNLIGAILNASSWVHQLEAQCMHLFA
jgi:hypothetical protein